MTELTIEYFTEDRLDAQVPCTVLEPASAGGNPCGKPSVARVIARCHRCGTTATDFMCSGCLWMLENGHINHAACHHPITDWKPI